MSSKDTISDAAPTTNEPFTGISLVRQRKLQASDQRNTELEAENLSLKKKCSCVEELKTRLAELETEIKAKDLRFEESESRIEVLEARDLKHERIMNQMVEQKSHMISAWPHLANAMNRWVEQRLDFENGLNVETLVSTKHQSSLPPTTTVGQSTGQSPASVKNTNITPTKRQTPSAGDSKSDNGHGSSNATTTQGATSLSKPIVEVRLGRQSNSTSSTSQPIDDPFTERTQVPENAIDFISWSRLTSRS